MPDKIQPPLTDDPDRIADDTDEAMEAHEAELSERHRRHMEAKLWERE